MATLLAAIVLSIVGDLVDKGFFWRQMFKESLLRGIRKREVFAILDAQLSTFPLFASKLTFALFTAKLFTAKLVFAEWPAIIGW